MPGSPRLDYFDMPQTVRNGISDALGANVVTATNAAGGFTPGPAAAASLADGRVVFIKACSSSMNPMATAMHRREAQVLAELPEAFPAPGLIDVVEVEDWFVLIAEHIAGVMPAEPFSESEVSHVLATVTGLARAGAICPVGVADPVGTHEIERATRWAWRQLRDEGAGPRAGDWVEAHLDDLVALEADWIDAASGPALLHRDLRADNMILTSDGGVAVDWPSASVGAPWIDLLGLLPDLRLGGGPDPHEVFGSHPVGAAAPAPEVDCMLASLTGYFTRQALQPPIPGVVGLREFQAAQGAISQRWLSMRMGWEPPESESAGLRES